MKKWIKIALLALIGAGVIGLGAAFFATKIYGFMFDSLLCVGILNLVNGLFMLFSEGGAKGVAMILLIGGAALTLFMTYALLFT
ncbi:MAG: hypothetical protein IJC91_06980 [Oscillospiraceae bacterium]|nr:hypothetical protein [Oscillospiraceae bacterium]